MSSTINAMINPGTTYHETSLHDFAIVGRSNVYIDIIRTY